MRGRECNRGKRDLERVYWRKERKGEERMEHTSASWELFLISWAESHALSPENTHSGSFLVCSRLLPLTPQPLLIPLLVLFTFTTFYSKHLSPAYPLLFSMFPSTFLSLICPFSPRHSLTFSLCPASPISLVEFSQNMYLASLCLWIPRYLLFSPFLYSSWSTFLIPAFIWVYSWLFSA